MQCIKLIAAKYPQSLSSSDSTGKLACHVAAKYDAPPSVMHYLVHKNEHAAGAQDELGKCPIHYVAEFYDSYDRSGDVNEHMLEVIRILKDVAP